MMVLERSIFLMDAQQMERRAVERRDLKRLRDRPPAAPPPRNRGETSADGRAAPGLSGCLEQPEESLKCRPVRAEAAADELLDPGEETQARTEEYSSVQARPSTQHDWRRHCPSSTGFLQKDQDFSPLVSEKEYLLDGRLMQNNHIDHQRGVSYIAEDETCCSAAAA
ncbi:hypothetical protein Q5P01_020460 [Channa striata]|uniref:Uncharacterized protein n=1 Tax=Channa striata TaxID=64152 RepID=A0AA88LXL2_CHASR|nr:hypothetical protein Q5P01_020460 [Channa striata]